MKMWTLDLTRLYLGWTKRTWITGCLPHGKRSNERLLCSPLTSLERRCSWERSSLIQLACLKPWDSCQCWGTVVVYTVHWAYISAGVGRMDFVTCKCTVVTWVYWWIVKNSKWNQSFSYAKFSVTSDTREKSHPEHICAICSIYPRFAWSLGMCNFHIQALSLNHI